ncbi:Polymerase (RNA) III (DNA directed) polypeptide E [Seminavis robusta]|uniref:Polymerase (RNA) III (DNA directed) polypeptide E n=1 Tax=Seminavis robusta TaxID=568900 RepID=A0A9N8HDV2_9STRA|nr:Polymerase (RNA) III (DNA directed) polypeptide E [Seminavis robusta]|eukprot:Sro359_g126010.1 Polymerase (RNA) III (DNA directed) polypeptide E (548) ;mRNA; r:8608-10251
MASTSSASSPKKRVRIKAEEDEDEDDAMVEDENEENADNSAMQVDDDQADEEEEEEEEDEVVREMEVYLSPHLVHQLYMLQFPLQQVPTVATQHRTSAAPIAVRVKPKHNMLELDQAIPTRYMEQEGLKHLLQRTYASHTVPVTTHLALGKVVRDDTSKESKFALHLSTLQHITQMRPTFTHIDQDDDDNADNIKALEEERANAANKSNKSEEDDKRKPLMFQKKESERAAMARKNSFAYKKASEEGENWVELNVIDLQNADEVDLMDEEERPSEEEITALKQAMDCPPQFRKRSVMDKVKQDDADETATTDNNKSTSLASYVRSLDYLPAKASASNTNNTTPGFDQAQQFLVDWKQAGLDETHFDLPTMGGHLTTLLKDGWPIPFSILKQSLPPNVDDKHILKALASCAVLVRGNFCLQSRLMTQLPKPVAKARTFALLLLQTMGVIHRSRLDHVFGIITDNNKDDDDNGNGNHGFHHESLNSQTVLMLLEQVAKKTPEGWVLRGQDDVQFLQRFPDNTNLHMQYWGRQLLRFQDYLQRYAEATVS